MAAITAERQLLLSLLAGCLAPVAALAVVQESKLHLRARVLAPDGSRMLNGDIRGPIDDSGRLGSQLAQILLDRGAADLIALARRGNDHG